MKAFILKQNGGIENLVKRDVPLPEPKDNEVLIQTKGIGINQVDSAVRAYGQMLDIITQGNIPEFVILGWDVSGEIVKTGNGVTQFKKGDQVFGLINMPGLGSTNAEYVVADTSQIVLIPENYDYIKAAATPLAALTAWQALVKFGKLAAGEKILIHGAAGGVGHFAVQMAKSIGAYVVGTGSLKNKDYILGIGADEYLDYNSSPFEEQVSDFDIVIDTVPAVGHIKRSIKVVKKGGRVVFLQPHFYEELAVEFDYAGVSGYGVFVNSSGEDLLEIAKLIEAGKIKTTVSKVFHFDKLPEAHNAIEEGGIVGKIAVTLN